MAGRPPKEKSFANMLKIALTAEGVSGQPKLREVAEVLVEEALKGESWAVQMIADRVDGKVPQAVVGDDDSDPINLVSRVVREIVRPRSTDTNG